ETFIAVLTYNLMILALLLPLFSTEQEILNDTSEKIFLGSKSKFVNNCLISAIRYIKIVHFLVAIYSQMVQSRSAVNRLFVGAYTSRK
ncbi:MAG: hypothetical protein L6R28_15145, partial [Planctomycetes bacterium]|nr:hypothetical protein [Planctomycetota bacterium]